MSAKITKLGLFIWALASLFFLYEFFLQVFQSTVASQIMQELHIDASSYAIMTAAYFLPYSLMQIPVGILADKFGAHLLLTLSAASCSLGVFGFSLTHHFNTAVIARLFMGLGAASAYVCLLLLAMNWFPKRHFAFMIGMANLIGSTGPFLAGGPLSYLLTLFNNNWRLILLCISGSGAILAICIGLFVRNNPTRNREEIIHLDPYAEPLRIKLKKLITNKQVWNIGLVSCLLYISLPLLGAYWGTGYLQARGLSRTHAASLSSTLWIGYALGAPLIGKFSDSIKRRKTPLLISSLIGLIASIFILTPPIQNPFFFLLVLQAQELPPDTQPSLNMFQKIFKQHLLDSTTLSSPLEQQLSLL